MDDVHFRDHSAFLKRRRIFITKITNMKTTTLYEAHLFDKYSKRLPEIDNEIETLGNSDRPDKNETIRKLTEERQYIVKWFIMTG